MARRSGQNGSIARSGDTWRGRWLEDVLGQNRRIRRSILLGECKTMTKSEAKRKLREFLEQKGVNSMRYVIPSPVPALTFGARAEKWEEDAKELLKPSTYRTMVSQIHKHFTPRLKDVAIDKVDTLLVNDLVVAWSRQGLRRNSIRNMIVTLGLILGRHIEDVKLPKRVDAEEEAPWFTPAQMASIVANADGMYKALFATAAGTGMRAGELFGLEVQDVDLNGGIIHVRRSVWEGARQAPKTRNAYRKVGIDAGLVTILKAYLGDRKSGYLFPTRNGTPLRLGNVVKRALHPILDEMKIPRSGMHAFRHGRVSFLVENNVPIVTIKAWIGHGSEVMIERYTHSRPEFHQSVLMRLPAIVAPQSVQTDQESTPVNAA